MTKKSHPLLGFLALVGGTVLSVGCAARVEAGGAVRPETPAALRGTATLVAIGDHVWVLRDSDRAIYFVDNTYWAYDQGTWSRSRTYDGGWVAVEASAVPAVLTKRDPTKYVHYEGPDDAETRPAPKGEALALADTSPPAADNPHGGPPGHDEVPGVGNQRKAEGESPGHVAHAAAPAKTEPSAPRKEKPSPAAPPGVGNERKSVGAQPGVVGHGGRAHAAAPKKRHAKK